MSKKSKRNCANPVFTYWERTQLGDHGTIKKRLGADMVKDWDACCLCLKQIKKNPLACQKGHLFCKDCIYENLWVQKEDIKQKTLLYKHQQAELKQQELSEIDKANQNNISKFILDEGRIIQSTSSTLLPFSTSNELSKNIINENKKQDKDKVDLTLNCFWIASNTPNAENKKIDPPPTNPICPEGSHILKLKHLKEVKFFQNDNTESKQNISTLKKSSSHLTGQYLCPSCRKHLTNAVRVVHLRNCGHVFCKFCCDKLIKPEHLCLICSETCLDQDIILLEAGGTGFSAHGAQIEATLVTPTFQTF